MIDERKYLEDRIRKMYMNSGEYIFESSEEAERFIKNATYYIEDEYRSGGHYRYRTLKDYSCDWKGDAIIHGVATKDYEWFL